ncbi:ankyrin repeat-containing domain protein, partial [Ephemerocybe angulata]
MSLGPIQIEGKQSLEVMPTFIQGQQSDVNILQGAENVSVGTVTTTIVSGNYNYNVTVINHYGPASSRNQPTVESPYEILAWLKGPNFLVLYAEALAQRLSRTGVWFIESEEFRQFVEERGVIVWGTGMPGAGKTLLSATSMEHLKEIFDSDDMQDVAVICAFIRYTEQLSTRDIFAGLLGQLIGDHPRAHNHMERVYLQRKKAGLSEQDLLKALRDVVTLLSKVFILIDGLDEASDTVKNALLHALPSIGANVLITSRPLDLYAHYVPLALRVSIEARTQDIELFVDDLIKHNARLQAIVRGQPALIAKLKARVRESSRGMFLVARLQMEAVMQTARSAKSLMKALEQLPAGVDEMYRNTLERIGTQSEDDTSVAHRVFIWLLYSMRREYHSSHPDILSIEELQHALAISLEDRAHDDGDIIPASMILSMCGGLVVTEEHSTRLDYRGKDYTAYEYLKAVSFPDQPLPHTLLAVSWVIYLEQYLEMLQVAQDTEAQRQMDSYPLLPYAITMWGRHAEWSQEYGPLHPMLCSFILGLTGGDRLQLRKIWSTLGMSREHISPLHLAVLYDLVEPITWVTLVYDNGPFSWGGLSPLQYSAINKREFEGETALMHACKTCDEERIKRLLVHPDIDVDVKDDRGRTAFWYAAADCSVHDRGLTHRTHGYEILSILIYHCPDIDITVCDKAGETVLMGACASGQADPLAIDVLGHLLNHWPTIDINQRDNEGRTALILAATGCGSTHPDMVQKLLCHPAIDVNAEAWDGRTALITACLGKPQTSVVRTLLSHPAVDVAILDHQNMSALDWA